MAKQRLTAINESNDYGYRENKGSTVADFLKQLNQIQGMQSDQEGYENELNKLRMTNVQNLGRLRLQQEREITKKAEAAANTLLNKERAAKKQALAIEMADKRKALAKEAKNNSSVDIKAAKQKVKAEEKLRRKQIDDEIAYKKKQEDARLKNEAKLVRQEAVKAGKKYQEELASNAFGAGKTPSERAGAIKSMFTAGTLDSNGNVIGTKFSLGAGLLNLTTALSDFSKQLETQIDTIAGKKSAIDTRLQGSKNQKDYSGSYWNKISSDITGIAGVSPLIKQSDIADNVTDFVKQGISFDVEQRAVLQTVSKKIADTFSATDATLLRLVRIQQQDTTAGRLGMESALTAFLNNMYETTEYMQNIANEVRSSLNEAMSLMSGENALSFEYQVQKWLGSMYSVGMSDTAVNGLSNVLGKLAAGQLDAITQGGEGNLVIMAANQAGLNISDLLNNGLDSTTTNELLSSIVDYMAKLYNEAGSSKVIQQQFASVYGVTASDLKAAVNLSKSSNAVSKNGLTYSSAIDRLNSMASSMYNRTSIGEMMTNAFDNVKYSMASGIASSPVLYALYKISGMLQDTVGSALDFSVPMVMGNGLPMTFSVPDIMRGGVMAGGIISSMAKMIAAGGGGGITGTGILKAAGINSSISQVTRGTGAGLSTTSGATVSESGSFIGNSDSSDVTNKTMSDTTDSAKSQTASATDESSDVTISQVDKDIVAIYDLLHEFKDGTAVLTIKTEPGKALDVSNISSGMGA
jgi:hypothetical protein